MQFVLLYSYWSVAPPSIRYDLNKRFDIFKYMIYFNLEKRVKISFIQYLLQLGIIFI